MNGLITLTLNPKYPFKTVSSIFYNTDFVGYDFNHEYFRMQKNGVFEIKKNYASNGITGILVYLQLKFFSNYIEGAIGHDGLYQAIELGFLPIDLRHVADDALYDRWVLNGANRVTANIFTGLVKMFGKYFIKT